MVFVTRTLYYAKKIEQVEKVFLNFVTMYFKIRFTNNEVNIFSLSIILKILSMCKKSTGVFLWIWNKMFPFL